MYRGRVRARGRGMSGGVLLLSAAVLVASLGTGAAKRFDCKAFCKSTGFSGMVGGCRCSFTLFTSKRSHPSQLELGPAAFMSEADSRPQFPAPPVNGEQDLHVLIPYLFFRDARRRGQKEVMEDTDFQGKNDLVFGNMYQ